MKKNFFKKLSFVMALAMIISVIAPAAGAFAATGLRLNATSKTLFLGENNAYNFNVLGKSTGATEKWTSSKTSVATVNAKNGVVTAKAVGTTTITATVTNAKKTVTKKLTAKVTVGDNVKTLKVVAPADADKLAVGTAYTFSTTFVTNGGSKTKTSNTTVWSVDKEGATIKDGVFTATEPGEYTVTATANRYKNVKVTSDSVKVTVVNSIKEVKQVSTDTFTVEFAGKVADLSTTTSTVAQVVNGKDVTTGAEKIKSVTLDTTGKIATVVLYADFSAKATYKFTFDGLTGTFVAASKDLKDVAGIVFEDFNVNTTTVTGTNLLDYIYAVNADGVKILTGSDISAYLTFDVTSDQTKGYVDTANRRAYIYTAGNTVTVKTTFTNYLYNETTKKYDTISYNDSAVGTGVSADVNTSTMQYAVATAQPTSLSSAWTNAISVAAGDSSLNIYARYKKTTDSSTAAYTVATTEFTYVSSDPTKLSVNGTTLYPIAAGTATVIVKNADGTKVLGSFDVQISTERVLATATPDVPTVSVGNTVTAGVAETKQITIATVDNLGTAMKGGQITAAPTLLSYPTGGSTGLTTFNVVAPIAGDNTGKVIVTANAAGKVTGFYQYKVTITDTTSTGSVVRDVIIGVTVVDSTTNHTAVNYVPVLEAQGDVNHIAKDSASFVALNGAVTYDVVVYGVNSYGYRVSKLNTGDFSTVITKDGATVTTGDALSLSTLVSTATVLRSTGVYNVSVKSASQGATGRASGVVLGVTNFTLSNPFAKSIAVKNYTVDNSTYSSIAQALNEALELTVTLGDNAYTVNFSSTPVTITGINASTGVTGILTTDSAQDGNLYIDQVTADITTAYGVKQFVFDVKQSIVIK